MLFFSEYPQCLIFCSFSRTDYVKVILIKKGYWEQRILFTQLGFVREGQNYGHNGKFKQYREFEMFYSKLQSSFSKKQVRLFPMSLLAKDNIKMLHYRSFSRSTLSNIVLG